MLEPFLSWLKRGQDKCRCDQMTSRVALPEHCAIEIIYNVQCNYNAHGLSPACRMRERTRQMLQNATCTKSNCGKKEKSYLNHQLRALVNRNLQ